VGAAFNVKPQGHRLDLFGERGVSSAETAGGGPGKVVGSGRSRAANTWCTGGGVCVLGVLVCHLLFAGLR
jgi:hypothetical protein